MATGDAFTPGVAQRPGRQLNPQQSEALKVLSLRLPSTLGGRPIAPEGLLQPGLSGGGPLGAVQSTLSRVGGGGSLGPPPAPPSLPTAAAPQPWQALGVANFGGGGSPFASQGPDLSALADLVTGALGKPPTFRYAVPGTGVTPPGTVAPVPPREWEREWETDPGLLSLISALFGHEQVSGGRGAFGGGGTQI